MKVKAYLKLVRLKHYLKNILIFLPVIFGRKLFDIENIKNLVLGFIVFSSIASIVYIINDICDIEKDRKHEIKKNRPLASGKITLNEAKVVIMILSIISIVLGGYLTIHTTLNGLIIPIIYMILNILYSKKLKNIPIIDVAILSSGFFLRVIYGAEITKIELSQWLYLTIIAFSLCLALGKRRNELVKSEKYNTRTVLSYYNYDFLDKNLYMCMGLGLVFYSLWTIDIDTVIRFGNAYFSWTIPLVLLILLRYNLIIEGDSYGDPVEVLLSDRTLIFLCILYAMIVLGIIYL